jgi:HK97 family phage major capsid protein
MSAAIDVKRREVEQTLRDAQAILDRYKDGLPAEQQNQLKAMQAVVSTKRAEIKAAEEEETLRQGFAEADTWLTAPQRTLPHGTNGDHDDKKALERAGWEFKGGMAYAPTSSGQPYEMFGEDVILGDVVADNPVFAAYQKTTRAAMSAEYKAAYCKFHRLLAMSGGEFSMAMHKMSPSEQKALSEGTDSAGGFTVPPDTQAELLMRTAQQAVMRRLARVQTTNRDMLRWPMLKAHASQGSIYSSAFVGSWTTETPAFSETDAVFQMFDIPIKKLRVAGKFSNDLLADSAFNLLATLATDGAQNMALVEDNGLLTGLGAANEPLGLLNGGFTTFDVEGTTANTVVNTTSSSGSAAKLIAGVYLIPDQYVAGSVALMSRTIEGKIAALVDGNGRPFWALNAGSGFASPPRSIEGLPIHNSSFMPSDGTDANKVVWIGNLAQAYIIGQRAQITSVVMRERFADTDQTGIILFERIGGAVWNTDAGRVGIV